MFRRDLTTKDLSALTKKLVEKERARVRERERDIERERERGGGGWGGVGGVGQEKLRDEEREVKQA